MEEKTLLYSDLKRKCSYLYANTDFTPQALKKIVDILGDELLQRDWHHISKKDLDLIPNIRVHYKKKDSSRPDDLVIQEGDYLSFAPYWHPNPFTEDNMPFVKKDGIRYDGGSLSYLSDRYTFAEFLATSSFLLLFYRLTKNKEFKANAFSRVEHFFCDEKHKVNPNLNFSQYVPGRTSNGTGLIDWKDLPHLFFNLFQISDAELTENELEIKNNVLIWIKDYTLWLSESSIANLEKKRGNNHQTFYFFQYLSLSCFLPRTEEYVALIRDLPDILMSQVDKTFLQTEENKRTKPIHYNFFNLIGWTMISETISSSFPNTSSQLNKLIIKIYRNIPYLKPDYLKGFDSSELEQFTFISWKLKQFCEKKNINQGPYIFSEKSAFSLHVYPNIHSGVPLFWQFC